MNRKQLASYFRSLEMYYKRKAAKARWTHERDRLTGRMQSYRQASQFITRQIEKARV